MTDKLKYFVSLQKEKKVKIGKTKIDYYQNLANRMKL